MPVQKITKEEIIRKAVEVFHKQGYNSTTMSDLAKACGLLKGSFYHHFSSKEELMHAVLAAVRAYYHKKIFSIARDAQLSPTEKLHAIRQVQQKTLAHEFGGCLFGNLTLETANVTTEFQAPLRAFFDDWVEALAHIFQASHPAETARELALESVMLMEGAAMLARLYQNNDYIEKAFQRILQKI